MGCGHELSSTSSTPRTITVCQRGNRGIEQEDARKVAVMKFCGWISDSCLKGKLYLYSNRSECNQYTNDSKSINIQIRLVAFIVLTRVLSLETTSHLDWSEGSVRCAPTLGHSRADPKPPPPLRGRLHMRRYA